MNRKAGQIVSTVTLALSFFALASASVMLTRFEGGAAFLWPATAPLIAFLAVRHLRAWPLPAAAIGFSSWAASSFFGVGTTAGIPIAIAIVAEGVIAALLLRRAREDPVSFDGLPSLAKFVVAAGVIAPALSGLLGAAAIALHTGQAFWPNWRAWFAAHSLGTITVAPLLLLFVRGEGLDWFRKLQHRTKVEASLLLAAVAIMAAAVFEQDRYPLLFLPFLPLVIATFRLGRLGAAGSVVILAAIGSVLTLQGHGPISLMHASVGARAQFFQLYLAVAVMIVLPAAAELRRRDALALRIRQSETTYRLLAENLADTLIHTSLEGDVLYASPAVSALTGFDSSAIVGKNSRDFVIPEDYEAFAAARNRAIGEPENTVAIEYRATVRDNVVIWCETRMRSYTNDSGTPAGVILVVRDVTERKAAEAELVLDAITDDLTGLPNRKAFFRRLAYLQSEVASGQGVGCVAIFDIDFFKRANDTHGHAAGDIVLRAVADAARSATRSGDMVARVGGEEFAIVLWGAAPDAAAQTCERVREAIGSCVVATPSARVRVTASFGIAEITVASQIDAVYRAADDALYAAKADGRNRLRKAA